MNAFTPDLGAPAERRHARASGPGMRWAALADAGAVVGALAGYEAEEPNMTVRGFPELIEGSPHWRRELAERAIDELAAIMEPGIAALLAVNARGADPGPAAQALWQEFSEARAAILELLPPSGAMGHRRYA